MLGRPLFGMRVQDIIRTIDYLRIRNDTKNMSIAVYGRDQGALLALYAAALDERISKVIVEELLISYEELVTHKRYKYNHNILLPGILQYFDIMDVATTLSPRHLLITNPVNNMKEKIDKKAVKRQFESTNKSYKLLEKNEKLKIHFNTSRQVLIQKYKKWLHE
jgi:cephalosporin-C deacetylase-like acetyl esterase